VRKRPCEKGNRRLVSVKWALRRWAFNKWASKGELGAKKGKEEGKAALHDITPLLRFIVLDD